MPLYRYVKASPHKPYRRLPVISYGLMTLGIILIIWTLWPILSFFIFQQAIVVQTISPMGDVAFASSNVSTNPNYWFPAKPQKKVVTPVNSYVLSIPALQLDQATVVIGGDDLKKSLIHYGGTGLPGDFGNSVIFGHSSLPQFYKGTKDYKAVFATLPTVKIGDEVIVQYDRVTYTYKIYDKVVVEPTDLTALEQHFDDSYITLVTCVPPGTLLYRLNVKAKLVRI